jgi:hypothetical protein
MHAKMKSPEEKIKRMTQELAEAYAEAAMAEAMSLNKGYDEVIKKLGKQLIEVHRIEAAETGTCTPPGTSNPMYMTQEECSMVPGCADWHIGQRPMGSLEWTSGCTPVSRGAWDSATEVFGKLGQVLAATYAKQMPAEEAYQEVIRNLSQLITEANKHPALDNGHVQANCQALRGV